jgi:hypothetical protein
MGNLFRGRGAVITSIIIITALIGGMVAVNYQPTISLLEKATTPLSILTNDDWHDGTNQSTPGTSVTYSDQYLLISNGQQDCLSRYMWLNYNDGTGARVGFELHCVFNLGGLDIANQKVLNWSDLNHIELILHSEGYVNGTWLGTMYSFEGFSIVSGNASSVSLSRYNNSDSSFYNLNNVIGSVSYWSDSATIGNVTLNTINYTSQGKGLEESIATFNVTIDSVISDGSITGNSQTEMPAPTVLSFQITHNATATEYKYGASIDWSGAKDFPTSAHMVQGQDYSLVASDLLMFNYGMNSTEVKQFSTDANNDTAIYLVNGQVMCREFFTMQYTIDGSPAELNTTRIYVPDDVLSSTGSTISGNQSAVYVVFDGFKYGNSTGLTFDPAVVTPNTLAPSNGASSSSGGSALSTGPDLGILIGIVLAAVAIVAVAALVVVRRRSR